jgi:hypothetical protein
VVIESVAAVIEVSDGSERVRLRFDRGVGMNYMQKQCSNIVRGLFREVPLHGRRARVTGFEASWKKERGWKEK